MLKSARDHFANDSRVKITEHDLSQPVPDLGYFDAVVSSFAIHHLKHERKRELYEEIYDINPTGVFCNLEHVASPSVELHVRFLNAIGYTPVLVIGRFKVCKCLLFSGNRDLSSVSCFSRYGSRP
jgi:tRNA (cmo5U34)-methyltransferase